MQKVKNSIYKNYIKTLNRYQLLIKEKYYFDNISWRMDGPRMDPKRIKTIEKVDCIQYIVIVP